MNVLVILKMLFINEAQKSEGEYHRSMDVDYSDSSRRFQLKKKSDYSKQFAHIYAKRLDEMRTLLNERAVEIWGNVMK